MFEGSIDIGRNADLILGSKLMFNMEKPMFKYVCRLIYVIFSIDGAIDIEND